MLPAWWGAPGFNLPECCRRSRSHPVTGPCRESPGPRSGGWGCETGAFSSFCRFCFSPSWQRFHRQTRRTRTTHAHARVRVSIAIQSGPVTPWDALGDEWVEGEVDGCNREGWEDSAHPFPACHWWIYRTEDGFPSPPHPPPPPAPSLFPLSRLLNPTSQVSFSPETFSLLLIAIASICDGECKFPARLFFFIITN